MLQFSVILAASKTAYSVHRIIILTHKNDGGIWTLAYDLI